MTSHRATVNSKSKFGKKTQVTALFDNPEAGLDEEARIRREASEHGLEMPEDTRQQIIRPSKFILGPF
ncbi:MAG: hypothetical protein ABSD32_15560 [Mycobacterium sp.]|jgi:hypothetical protein